MKMIDQKNVSYQSTNSYNSLFSRTDKTRKVWIVFHGLGHLSRRFLRHFRDLDPAENYIVAPQAPSRYYLDSSYQRVGASWATKEDTGSHMDNALNYIDAVIQNEQLKDVKNLIVLGYSQGVSVAARWVAQRKIQCAHLVFHSGRVPTELQADDFRFLGKTPVTFACGTEDAVIGAIQKQHELSRMKQLFPQNLELFSFDGGHQVNQEVIQKIALR